MSHITLKCRLMWISYVIGWLFMVIIPLLLFSFYQRKVDFWWLWWSDMKVINCINSLAFTVHWTFLFFSTIRKFQLVTRCGCNLTIMPFVSFGHILDTVVINLDCVSVENPIYLPSISIKPKISDCRSTSFCDTQRPQRQLAFQSNVSFNKSFKKRTWKSE